jgi:hypothetical protein
VNIGVRVDTWNAQWMLHRQASPVNVAVIP